MCKNKAKVKRAKPVTLLLVTRYYQSEKYFVKLFGVAYDSTVWFALSNFAYRFKNLFDTTRTNKELAKRNIWIDNVTIKNVYSASNKLQKCLANRKDKIPIYEQPRKYTVKCKDCEQKYVACC